QELRGRIASVQYIDGQDRERDHATHYSYDIHGNVREMIQEFPSLTHLGYDFIRVQYEYDLLSGNVHAVHLAPDMPELAMSHYYEYDADNRLTRAYTQRHGQPLEKESVYDYNELGVLARMELGEEAVQGLDYAYTIHGWLKAVNGDVRQRGFDMGLDGTYDQAYISGPTALQTYYSNNPGVHSNFARDAFGYSLKYYSADSAGYADYTSIRRKLAGAPGVEFEATNWENPNFRSLYNGNIGAMVTSLLRQETHLSQYTYDQLNRITGMDVYQGLGTNGTWSPQVTQDYQTRYSFDGNGNILTLTRNGDLGTGPQQMDNLTYNYQAGTNRLLGVEDQVAAGAYSNDFDSHANPTNNYIYDPSGNLIEDKQEGIANIVWNADGKIRSITRTVGNAMPDLEFRYNAQGHRVIKVVKPTDQETDWTYTYYVRDPRGNVLATLKRTYDPASNVSGYSLPVSADQVEFLKAEAFHLYGSKRLGIQQDDTTVLQAFAFRSNGFDGQGYVDKADTATVQGSTTVPSPITIQPFMRGRKQYELSNHLGNVLVTISDKKLIDSVGYITMIGGQPTPDTNYSRAFQPDIISLQDYYPYGMVMTGRSVSLEDYRYGFQGMESEPEVSGIGNNYHTYYRSYDSRLGRWKSLDPKANMLPYMSPYAAFNNNPNIYTDPDGD
ncbi:MAG: RHS repeat-associated core domain-containing protein, partial [Bacteroidota bacterium]